MPRALKCSDEEKIRILDEYIVVVRHGNTDKIKFTDIASYACEKGYTNLKEFDFRQNDACSVPGRNNLPAGSSMPNKVL